MKTPILPIATVEVDVDAVQIIYALEGVTRDLEKNVLEGGYEPTHAEHDRMASLSTSAKVLTGLLGAWRDKVIEDNFRSGMRLVSGAKQA